MTNKQIVQNAISRKAGGGVPFDIFEGWMWPGINAKIMERTCAGNYEELLRAIGACCRWITAPYKGPTLPIGATDRIASPHTRFSLNASIWGLKPGLKEHGAGTSGHPLANAQSEKDILAHPWPSPEWFDFESIQDKKKSDQFIVFGGFSPLFYLIADFCGMEKTLTDLLLNPALIQAIAAKIEEFYTGYFSRVFRHGKGIIDAVAFGDDFSSQSAMLLGPRQWRDCFKPVWKRLFTLAKENNLSIFFHSCGAVSEIIPDLIDAGLDVLYPIQPTALNMDLGTLMKKFGGYLSFYGGFDVQDILPFGTPADIKIETRRIMRLAGKRGGFVLSTSHVIMEDVPVDNVMALYTEARKAF